jgi:hypothetical protein
MALNARAAVKEEERSRPVVIEQPSALAIAANSSLFYLTLMLTAGFLFDAYQTRKKFAFERLKVAQQCKCYDGANKAAPK